MGGAGKIKLKKAEVITEGTNKSIENLVKGYGTAFLVKNFPFIKYKNQ